MNGINETQALQNLDGSFENTWAYYTKKYDHGNGQFRNMNVCGAECHFAGRSKWDLKSVDCHDLANASGLDPTAFAQELVDSASDILQNQSGPQGQQLNTFLKYNTGISGTQASQFILNVSGSTVGPQGDHNQSIPRRG